MAALALKSADALPLHHGFPVRFERLLTAPNYYNFGCKLNAIGVDLGNKSWPCCYPEVAERRQFEVDHRQSGFLTY